LGVNVLGAFVAGGAPISNESMKQTRSTLKNAFDFTTGKRPWSIGAIISRYTDVQNVTPNPNGEIQFSNLQDYILSATAAAPTGTAFLTRGMGKVRYGSYQAAPFVEGEILQGKTFSVRGGVRGDYQTAGGILFSPRLSAVVNLHSFVVRGGTGMFVQGWSNAIFLRTLENNGNLFQQFLIPNVSLSGIGGTAIRETEVIAKIAPGLAPNRNWMSKVSVEHPFGNFVPGIEYTWTASSRLLGSERLTAPNGFIDWLKSDRDLRKQQVHFRAQYKVGGESFIADYEWVRSFDNTDGPFSFPQQQDNLLAEWARSSGVSPHNFTLVGNFKLPSAISLTLVETARSSAPYNITSGLDLTSNGLFNDRGGRPRNSGKGPSYNSLSIYAYRRIAFPRFLPEGKKNFHVNVGVQANNLLSNHNYLTFDSVSSSPLFGQPLAALPGRSLRLWFNFE
jgi:hypothetical protein